MGDDEFSLDALIASLEEPAPPISGNVEAQPTIDSEPGAIETEEDELLLSALSALSSYSMEKITIPPARGRVHASIPGPLVGGNLDPLFCRLVSEHYDLDPGQVIEIELTISHA